MSENYGKTYVRYFAKIDPRTDNVAKDENGKPILGDKDRECYLTAEDVEILHGERGYTSDLKVYVEKEAIAKMKPKEVIVETDEKPEGLQIADEFADKTDEELKAIGKEMRIPKAHLMKRETLITEINNRKEE